MTIDWERRQRITPKVFKLIATSNGKLPWYAWPGGYPLYYIHFDAYDEAHVLCPECAQATWESIQQGTESGKLYFEINWEDPELICECGKRIESAYAEKD